MARMAGTFPVGKNGFVPEQYGDGSNVKPYEITDFSIC